MEWNYLSVPTLHWLHRWSLGMDALFHPTPYNGCNYPSMLEIKLIYFIKRASVAFQRHYESCVSCLVILFSNMGYSKTVKSLSRLLPHLLQLLYWSGKVCMRNVLEESFITLCPAIVGISHKNKYVHANSKQFTTWGVHIISLCDQMLLHVSMIRRIYVIYTSIN